MSDQRSAERAIPVFVFGVFDTTAVDVSCVFIGVIFQSRFIVKGLVGITVDAYTPFTDDIPFKNGDILLQDVISNVFTTHGVNYGI